MIIDVEIDRQEFMPCIPRDTKPVVSTRLNMRESALDTLCNLIVATLYRILSRYDPFGIKSFDVSSDRREPVPVPIDR